MYLSLLSIARIVVWPHPRPRLLPRPPSFGAGMAFSFSIDAIFLSAVPSANSRKTCSTTFASVSSGPQDSPLERCGIHSIDHPSRTRRVLVPRVRDAFRYEPAEGTCRSPEPSHRSESRSGAVRCEARRYVDDLHVGRREIVEDDLPGVPQVAR